MSTSARKNQAVLMALAAAVIAILLYWPSLSLPVIYDSLLHIRIAKSLDLVSVWFPTERFGFYRPLIFLPLILIRDLFGYYPAWLLHGLNVAQHGLNAALLVALSWRLWHRASWALAAGLLLALHPFAYQAVAVNGHNVHLTAAGLALLGLHAYLTGLQRRQGRWWLLATALFLAGLLNHETAVLFGVLAALVQWSYQCPRLRQLTDKRPRIREIVFPWSLYLLIGAVYAGIYQFLPISREVLGSGPDQGLWLKTLYLLQGAAYPLTWFGHLLPGLGAVPAVLAGLGIVAALTAWAAGGRFNRLPLLLGWGWWGSFSLLLLASLPSDYLLHGPRLLYLGGVGLALVWPVLLEPLRETRLGRFLWVAVLGFVLVTGWQGIRDHLGRYDQLTAPITLIRDEMAGRPLSEGVLVVNLPAWLAPPSNTYPVGAEHVSSLGHHLFVEELVTVNLRTRRPVRAIKLPELLREPGYSYAVFGESDLSQPVPADWAPAGSQVFVTAYTDQGIRPEHVGQLSPPTGSPPVAQFGAFPLYQAKAVACGGAVEVTTSWGWSDDQLPAETLSLFVQLLDDEGQLVAQADGPPFGLRFNLIAPVPGWQMVDRRVLRPATDDYPSVLLGVYNYVDGERLAGRDVQGCSLIDDALRLPVQDCLSGEQRPD
jgi:hypothetical protein